MFADNNQFEKIHTIIEEFTDKFKPSMRLNRDVFTINCYLANNYWHIISFKITQNSILEDLKKIDSTVYWLDYIQLYFDYNLLEHEYENVIFGENLLEEINRRIKPLKSIFSRKKLIHGLDMKYIKNKLKSYDFDPDEEDIKNLVGFGNEVVFDDKYYIKFVISKADKSKKDLVIIANRILINLWTTTTETIDLLNEYVKRSREFRTKNEETSSRNVDNFLAFIFK